MTATDTVWYGVWRAVRADLLELCQRVAVHEALPHGAAAAQGVHVLDARVAAGAAVALHRRQVQQRTARMALDVARVALPQADFAVGVAARPHTCARHPTLQFAAATGASMKGGTLTPTSFTTPAFFKCVRVKRLRHKTMQQQRNLPRNA